MPTNSAKIVQPMNSDRFHTDTPDMSTRHGEALGSSP
jgi:hypothetical protein